jgi:hypothetical protein
MGRKGECKEEGIYTFGLRARRGLYEFKHIKWLKLPLLSLIPIIKNKGLWDQSLLSKVSLMTDRRWLICCPNLNLINTHSVKAFNAFP